MRAVAIKPASTWTGEPADCVVLDYDNRHRRRIAMTGEKGIGFLLDLPSSANLRSGDALLLDDGRLIEVIAAVEPLLEIRCTDAKHLARVAWHLGNRHVPAQILGGCFLRIRRDNVLADLAVQLGAAVTAIDAQFNPEGGAYAATEHTHRADGGEDPYHV